MNTQTLKAAERHYRSAAKRAETARKERNAFVVIALAEGWTYARISGATGLSRSRIGQLARALRPHV